MQLCNFVRAGARHLWTVALCAATATTWVAAAEPPQEAPATGISRLLSVLPDKDAEQVVYSAAEGDNQAASEETAATILPDLPGGIYSPMEIPDRMQWGWLDLRYGAQWRYRYHDEDNLRLNGQDDTFLLRRTRLWVDGTVADLFRARIEVIDAISYWEDLRPRFIDENRWDLLNAWGEITLWNPAPDQRVAARIGRQELLYGSQRLISPLDWANTRRTFEGYRIMSQYGPFQLDFFWVRPFDPDRKSVV